MPMKYLPQFCIILGFTLAGEVLQRIIPLPIPAAVYGLVLLFLALCLKLVKVTQVKDAGSFLTSLLPLLFVSPTVGILDCWTLIQPRILTIALLLIASTCLVFGIGGLVTQALGKKEGDGNG